MSYRQQEIMLKVILLLSISPLVFMIVDVSSGYSKRSTAEVVDKIFREEQTYVVMRTTTDGNGNTQMYPAVEHDPPSWSLVVRLTSGDVVTISCSAQCYYLKQYGDIVPVKTRYGRFTDAAYFRTVN